MARLSRLLAGTVMAVILVAGLLKATELQAFHIALASWAFIPGSLRTPIAVFIVAAECLFPLHWFANIYRKAVVALVGGFVIAATMFYIVHLIWAQPPDCGCFGRVDAYFADQHRAALLIGRNASLLAMLCFSIALQRGKESRHAATSVHPA